MKVIQICADKGIAPGATKGASQHLRGIAEGLSALGHEVVTYTAREAAGPFPTQTRPIADLDAETVAMSDVVYERYALGHTRALELAERSGTPFVLEVNAPLVDEANAQRPETVRPTDRSAEKRLLQKADLVIAVSSDLGRWAGQHRNGPVEVLSNGFEPAWFANSADSPKTHDLVFLGHPKPWHGADRLPRVLRRLEELGHRASLLVVGGGPGSDNLLDEAARVGVRDRVTVTGALAPETASSLVSSARVGLAPYPKIEPFYFCPLKVVDYMAAGLPLVATAQGDIPTLVQDAGLLADPDDEAEFANHVALLLDDGEIRSEMGARGWARAHRDMTWEKVARRTADAIAVVGSLGKRRACGAAR